MESQYLVFDTETTTDPTQRFNFGWFRHVSYSGNGRVHTLSEGIIYADELPTRDPDGFQRLRIFGGNAADVDLRYLGTREPNTTLEFLSRAEFVQRWVYGFVAKQGATLVGFNLPFDISRIAIGASESRREMQGGFSFQLHPSPGMARIRVKHLDNKKSLMGWSLGLGANIRGAFLDLRTLAFALTSRGHSLASACVAFEVPARKSETEEHGSFTDDYIGYARQDVKASSELLGALLREYERHELVISPERLLSPASLAKAYYKKMGIVPPLNRSSVTNEILGYTMATFFGARAECHVRKVPVPVTLVDFTSMYPTVNALMGLWQHLTADRLTYKHGAKEVQHFVNGVTLEACFNRDNWRKMVGIARIRADNDILPVRARYGPDRSFNIGINRYTNAVSDWYAIPDIVASVLLTGKSPVIEDAILFTYEGRNENLEAVDFLGHVSIDPTDADFFKWVIEERASIRESNPKVADVLKIIANSGCYGIFIEMNRSEQPESFEAFGIDNSWQVRNERPEIPGIYCYPPIATCITAGARLMLAMLERSVTDAHGTWAFADTDSMAIVTGYSAIETTGESIPAVPRPTIESIRRRFNALSPYSRELVPDLLKVEFEGYAYVISAKRYCLFNSIGIHKYSEHGLGHLRGPSREWVGGIWNYLLNAGKRPEWFDLPALTQWGINTPGIWRAVDVWNEGKAYPEQIKPFNFVSICYPRKQSVPPDQKKFRLLAPYTTDPKEMLSQAWYNQYDPDGPTYEITAANEILSWRIGVKTYGEIAEEYGQHPEYKASDSAGRNATTETIGVLGRRHIKMFYRQYLGKESNNIEERQAGLFDEGDIMAVDRPIWVDLHDTIFDLLYHHFTQKELASTLRVSRVSIHRWETGEHIPTRKRQHEIYSLAALCANKDLGKKLMPSNYVQLFMEWQEFNLRRGEDHSEWWKWSDTQELAKER